MATAGVLTEPQRREGRAALGAGALAAFLSCFVLAVAVDIGDVIAVTTVGVNNVIAVHFIVNFAIVLNLIFAIAISIIIT